MKKSQKWGASFENTESYYGGGLIPREHLIKTIIDSLDFLKDRFSQIWQAPQFDILRTGNFEANQHYANIAHIFFEQSFHVIKADPSKAVAEEMRTLLTLNTSIHQLEADLVQDQGFFLDISLPTGLRGNIHPSENKFFSLDKEWGELFLTYCQLGENYVQAMQNNYPGPPTPQTKIAGDAILYFRDDFKYQDYSKLENWLKHTLKKEVVMKELPLGEVPLGKITGSWSRESIKDFFKSYPHVGRHILFDSLS